MAYQFNKEVKLRTECEHKADPIDKSFGTLPSVRDWTSDSLPRLGILAVVDEPNDKRVSLAKPLSIENEEIKLHYYGTCSAKWHNAVFSLIWIEADGDTLMRPPKKNEPASPWTGVVPLDPDFSLWRFRSW